MNDTVLDVKKISKRYGVLDAVSTVSFTIKEAEVFAIMGPNGAGKSTTLECILGTKQHDSGSVSLLGMDPKSNRREVFSRVGVQFQSSAWQPDIRVSEICESTACLYSPVPDWKPMLKRFKLDQRAKTAAGSLSGGEKQKLAILLACIHSPEVVFLDELTTGLDPIARRETWKMIMSMKESGITIVLISHVMEEIEQLADRGMIMNHGKIITIGTLNEIREKYSAKNLEEAYIQAIFETQEVSA